MNSARRLAATWTSLHTNGPVPRFALHTIAHAIAADHLTDTLPDVAASLRTPWQTALRVRTQLRTLGPAAEHAAQRLVPSWRLPIDQLPAAVTAITIAPTAPESPPQPEPSG